MTKFCHFRRAISHVSLSPTGTNNHGCKPRLFKVDFAHQIVDGSFAGSVHTKLLRVLFHLGDTCQGSRDDHKLGTASTVQKRLAGLQKCNGGYRIHSNMGRNLIQGHLGNGAVVGQNSGVGNDKIDVVDAIRDACDSRGGARVIETIDLDDDERALGSMGEICQGANRRGIVGISYSSNHYCVVS